MKRQSSGRIYYMECVRIIACVLIVLVHVSAQEWDKVSVHSHQWQVMNIFDCLGVMGVPMFLMISGALMLGEKSGDSIKKTLGKVFRLFVIYHIWLFVYNFVAFVKAGHPYTLYYIKEELLLPVMRGQGTYHLWFLPVLMVLYLLTPILKRAFSDQKVCEYFLILYFIFGQLIPTMLLFEFPYKYLLMDYYNRTPFLMLTGYIGYYVAGHYIHHFVGPLSSVKRCVAVFVAIAGYVVTVVVCSTDAMQKGAPSVILNNPLTLPDFLATTCAYLVMKDVWIHRKQREGAGDVAQISGLTFGIYLIHPLLLAGFREIGVTTQIPHPVVMVPLITVLVLVFSMLISWMLKKIPVVSKFIL